MIAVANQKGGVGKTTTSVNLSVCLAKRGKKVLLVDVDPQGNATSGLGMRGEGTCSIYHVLIDEASPEDAILHTQFYGLDLIPTSIELAGAEIELVDFADREQLFKLAFEKTREAYDYIIIDCPPSLNLLTLNALTAADSIFIPIQCEYYALEGLGQLMNTVKLMRKKLNPSLTLEGIVFTMYDGRTNLCGQVAQEVRAHFAKEVFQTVIPRNVRLSEAPSYGLPICEYDPKCIGARAYEALADELIQRGGQAK